jgi:aminomethyltransferase
MTQPENEKPARTPLYARHLALGGRMTPFAGYELPVNYAGGILGEHLFTRESAGLFDVSHMGQAILKGTDAARKFESLVPGDILGLAPGRIRYTQFTNAQGGIFDDLLVTKLAPDSQGERLFVVVNAACKTQDFVRLRESLPDPRASGLAGAARGGCAGALRSRRRGDGLHVGAEFYLERRRIIHHPLGLYRRGRL